MLSSMLRMLLASCVFWTMGSAFASGTEGKMKMKPTMMKGGKPTVVTLTNKEVKGKDGQMKKVWLPKTVPAKPGKIKFVLKNTLAAPHGFQIKGIMPEGKVVAANATEEVTVDIKKKGDYDLECHMHPAHVGSKLKVR